MKKTYMNPTMKTVVLKAKHNLLGMSGLGKAYTETDVTYARGLDIDDDEEE